MSTRKIVTNTFYYGVIPKVTLLISVFTLPLTTPFLTPYDYGIVGIINSYTSILASIAPLGMNVHLTNAYYENPKHFNLVWGRVLFVFLLSGLFFGLVNIGIIYSSLPIKSFSGLFLALMGSAQVFLFANGTLAQHIFPLLERPKPLVFSNLLASVLGIVVSFVMIVYFNMGYWGLLASPTITSISTFLLFIYPIWIKRDIYPMVEKNMKRLKQNLKIALPIIPHTLGFVLLASSSRIIMNFYKVSIDDIGLFNHGYTLGEYILVITNALILALVPQIQVAYRNQNFAKYRHLYYLCQGVALVCTFLFCIWLPQGYELLIKNESLRQSCSIATMICFANIVFPFYFCATAPAFIQKKTVQLLWMVFVPGILNIILCLLFIPFFGYLAAVYTTMASYWSQILIPFVVPYYKETVPEWLGSKRKLLFLMVVLVCIVIVGNIISKFSIWIKVVMSLIIVTVAIKEYFKLKFNTLV